MKSLEAPVYDLADLVAGITDENRHGEVGTVLLKASDFLKEAASLVDGDRADAYGDCVECHTRIAHLWTGFLRAAGVLKDGAEVDAHLAALMLVDLKRARALNGGYHKDSYIDGSAYMGLAGEIKGRSFQARG